VQVKDWEPKLNSITDWFGQLQAIDLDNVAPLLRAPSSNENRTRPDVIVANVLSETFLDTVPDREGPFIKVPKISTGADQ
jgi:aspartyl/glutamyl-tRNA(Asn/Gln) amidotransferase C subunit